MVKRVLIFSFVYYPRFIGGAEVAVKEITDRTRAEDIEFDLIAMRVDNDLPELEKIGNVNIYRIAGNRYLYPFLACMKASRLHKKRNYGATWSIMANYSGFAALFFKLFHMNVPFILTLQEGDPIDYIKRKVRFVAPIWKMIFTYADRIQTISHYLADFARDMGAKCPVEVVPNGVDVSLFTKEYPKGELEEIKKNLNIPGGSPIMITTSRLVVKNAVSDVIKSLEYISEAYFLILGTGYQETELKKLASDIGVSDRVKFLGFVPHTEMPKYLKISDIFIRPSLSEGFGNSFIEAMAAKTPVIATPVGGIVDFLRDKETGLFCEVNSPEDIARKVGVYLHDKNLRDEIVDNAFRQALEQYDWNLVARDMKEKVFSAI